MHSAHSKQHSKHPHHWFDPLIEKVDDALSFVTLRTVVGTTGTLLRGLERDVADRLREAKRELDRKREEIRATREPREEPKAEDRATTVRPAPPAVEIDVVALASEDSFPASDAPGWIGSSAEHR